MTTRVVLGTVVGGVLATVLESNCGPLEMLAHRVLQTAECHLDF